MGNKTKIQSAKETDAEEAVVFRRDIAEDNKAIDFDLLLSAAEQGNADAQFLLAELYYRRYEDGDGTENDLNEAVQWYQESAGHGNAMAQFEIGWCYQSGNGVEEDQEKAVKWYRIAAEQGYAVAQYWLGWCCQYGQGVEADLEEAVKWYRIAAEQGNEEALNALAELENDASGHDAPI